MHCIGWLSLVSGYRTQGFCVEIENSTSIVLCSHVHRKAVRMLHQLHTSKPEGERRLLRGLINKVSALHRTVKCSVRVPDSGISRQT